jgi:hypothetical protein
MTPALSELTGGSAKVSRRAGLIAIARFLLLLAPWAFIAYLFRDVGATLDSFRDASVGPIVGALLLILLVLTTLALLWVRLVTHLNREPALSEVPRLLRTFARSWLARYLPGKVWIYGARVIHTDASVSPARIVASSVVDEFALIVGTATVLGLASWTWFLAGPVVGLLVLLTGLAAVVVAVSRLDQLSRLAVRFLGRRLPRRWESVSQELQRAGEDPRLGVRATALFTGSYLLNNFAGGLAFVLVVVSLSDIGWGDVPLLVGAYSLASVVGIAALFAPAGLGVREAVLAGFITPVVASPVAASVVVLVRVLAIIADVLFVGVIEATSVFSRRTAMGAVARVPSGHHKSTPRDSGS